MSQEELTDLEAQAREAHGILERRRAYWAGRDDAKAAMLAARRDKVAPIFAAFQVFRARPRGPWGLRWVWQAFYELKMVLAIWRTGIPFEKDGFDVASVRIDRD